MKSELVAILSHELRAPLGAIKSSIDALKSMKGVHLSEEAESLLGVIDRGVQKLSKLVDELTDLSRIDIDQLNLRCETFDARTLIERVASLYEGRFRARGIELKLETPDEPVKEKGDPERLEQVLSNLCENSLKFTEKGCVTLGVRATPEKVIYTVKDTGKGIAPEFHEKIFEKFSSVGEPVRGEPQGIGLGLAICKAIVEGHGGKMTLSSAVGKGTTFLCEIPREAPACEYENDVS
ncbi:MAG: HAMP domain-containing sensor histidine kinase [Actinomycetota bacterium]|nr:HAMP domain-containing sensor histidine kinase [Actinomycetota bacterium]